MKVRRTTKTPTTSSASAVSAVEELGEYLAWLERERRAAVERFAAASNPRDEKLLRLTVKAGVERALESERERLRDQVAAKRYEAEEWSRSADELEARADAAAVDEAELVRLADAVTAMADEADARTVALGVAIADGEAEARVVELERARADAVAEARRLDDELDSLRARAAEAPRWRAEAAQLRLQADALLAEADVLQESVEERLMALRPQYAVTIRDDLRRRAELLARTRPTPSIDSATEIWSPISIVGDGIKSIDIPLN